MGRFFLISLLLTGLTLAGCSVRPTREEFVAMETRALRCYCASNAFVAEAALLECARYAEKCRKAAVPGILYDEASARIYGRLYILERRLGHSAQAEQCLEKYARHHAASSTLARRSGRTYGEMEKLIEDKFNQGLETAWKTP